MRWPWQKQDPLYPANVPGDWIERHRWVEWESPRNVIAGEASYLAALTSLTGPTCEHGYCRPAAVTLVREPRNPYDQNAFRAEVSGQLVGYLRRQYAAALASPLDEVGCRSFVVAGLLRGGSHQAPNVGCHVWLGRRLSAGPEIELPDDAYVVSWPPRDQEVFGQAA